MARILTTTRLLNVVETVNFKLKNPSDWVDVKEIFYGEKMNGDSVRHEQVITLNKKFIIEMCDDKTTTHQSEG